MWKELSITVLQWHKRYNDLLQVPSEAPSRLADYSLGSLPPVFSLHINILMVLDSSPSLIAFIFLILFPLLLLILLHDLSSTDREDTVDSLRKVDRHIESLACEEIYAWPSMSHE